MCRVFDSYKRDKEFSRKRNSFGFFWYRFENLMSEQEEETMLLKLERVNKKKRHKNKNRRES